MGHLVQMAGLAVQNFVSAAVGIAVAVALVRGFARSATGELGQLLGRPGPDLPAGAAAGRRGRGGRLRRRRAWCRTCPRGTDVTTLAGATQHITGGPVASQEIIKEFGTNGGGFYNANSAHPFENPTTWTNWLEIFLLLVIPFSLPRVVRPDGRRQPAGLRDRRGDGDPGDRAASSPINVLQVQHGGTVPQAVGAATEGTETRFGVPQSATFAAATTLTSTGAVDSFHDSYTALGGDGRR